MTTPQPSPLPPAPISAPDEASRPRGLDLLGVALVLPGLTILAVGTGAALLHRDLTVDHPDTFPWLAPLAQLGWGLLAVGLLLSLLVSAMALASRRWRAAARASLLGGLAGSPRWGIGAGVWAYLAVISVFSSLALLPREVLLAWYSPSQSTIWDAWRSMVMWVGALLVTVLVALLPTIVLRLVARRR
ncbi:MAG TPA: hypothetical protein VF808_06190 [Ktedonobacterales bacterium]